MPKPVGILHGPLGKNTVHICIDMQDVFYKDTPWHTPWMKNALPAVTALARAMPSVFTRFITPHHVDECGGAWKRYYTRWETMTQDRLDPALLSVIPALLAAAPDAVIIDKSVYSPWFAPHLHHHLHARGCDTLVISGGETDICVLAAVMGAVDHGYRVIIAHDAVCSASDTEHDAVMQLYRDRFSCQIETASTDDIIAALMP